MTAEHAAGVGGEVEALLEERDAAFERAAFLLAQVKRLTREKAALLTTRATAADTVLATARRLCCGDNPAPHHAATDAHSQRMAFAEELARAVRES